MLGLPFDEQIPYFPIDEVPPPRPQEQLRLGEALSEEMARYFNAKFGRYAMRRSSAYLLRTCS